MTGEAHPAGLQDPAVARDPYPYYADLRRQGDAVADPHTRSTYVVGYELATRLLSSPALRARGALPADHVDAGERGTIERAEQFFAQWMVFDDSTTHEALRSRLLPALSGARSAQLVREVHDAVATAVNGAGRDAVTDVAEPLARLVLQRVLGADRAEVAELTALSNALIDYLATADFEPEAARAALAAVADLRRWTVTAAAAGRGPIMPVLGAMVDSGELSVTGATATVAQFLTGVMEPTSTLLAGTLELLRQSPHHLDAVRAGRLGADDVVEESLRFDPPFHFAPRTAGEDLVLDQVSVERGSRVVILLAAANRDERIWPDPEVFDPTRPRRRQLAFGLGRHSCLGATVARKLACHLVQVAAARQDRLSGLAPLERVELVGGTRWRAAAGRQ